MIGEVMFEDPKAKAKADAGRKLPAGRKRVAYFKMFMGLVYLGLFVVCGGKFNYATALTPAFAQKNLFVRYVTYHISIII
jgi:lysophospholipid acyltransferase